MKTLKLGMRDAAVKILQTELNRIGNKLTADGAFGPGTLAAVKAFQQSLQLVADGIVGYSTWQALFFPSAPGSRTTHRRRLPISRSPTRLRDSSAQVGTESGDSRTRWIPRRRQATTTLRRSYLLATAAAAQNRSCKIPGSKRLHTLPEVDKDPLQRWHRRIRSPRAGTQDKR